MWSRNEYVCRSIRLFALSISDQFGQLWRRVAFGCTLNVNIKFSLSFRVATATTVGLGQVTTIVARRSCCCVFHLHAIAALTAPGDSKIVKILLRCSHSDQPKISLPLSTSISLCRSLCLPLFRLVSQSLRGVCFYESRIRCFA